MNPLSRALSRLPDPNVLQVQATEPGLLHDLASGKRLSNAEFTVYQHCIAQGDRPDSLWNFRKCQPQPGWNYLGWCPSDATAKPETGWGGAEVEWHVAVLLENGASEKVWLHIPCNQAMRVVASHVINNAIRSARR